MRLKKRESILMDRYAILIAAVSALFSLCVTVGSRVVFSGDVLDKQTHTYIAPMQAADILQFAVLSVVTTAVMLAISGRIGRDGRNPVLPSIEKKRCFACVTACLLIAAWMPYVLSVAPGNVHSDSLASIEQVMAFGRPTNNHHPMFYTLFVGLLSKVSTQLWGSATIGVLIYSVLQMAFMLMCIVYTLTYMYSRGTPWLVIGASLAYYMFIPLFPNYAVTMWKDPVFSGMLLLLSVLLYKLTDDERINWHWMVCFGAAGFGAMVFRNNGLYVVAGTIMLAACLIKRHMKKIAISGMVALVLFVGLVKTVTLLWNIQGDFVENIGIPLQQIGYTLTNEGDFSEEDREYLYDLMPEEVWSYAYRPCLVDPIKWNPQFNYYYLIKTKPRFFSVWFNGLIRNPAAYIKAYLLATYGFWMPGIQNDYGYMDVFIQINRFGIERMDLFEKITGFSLLPLIENWRVYIGCGTMLWICLFACVLAMRVDWRSCVVYLPALLNWGTIMIATPTAFSLRYAFIFALGLPLYVSIPFALKKQSYTEETEQK